MSAEAGKSLLVALAGNPNAGKTSLFNALTGSRHKVGNYPGVTVEKREGIREHRGVRMRFVDLPGTYSLTAYSLDEMVARDFVLDEKPDIVVDVVDSTTLERSLALFLQFQELGVPLVGALNMSDEAERNGIMIDTPVLSSTIGAPLVRTVGTTGRGVEALLDAILEAAGRGPSGKSPHYGPEIEAKLATLVSALNADVSFASRFPVRWFALRLVENDSDASARLSGHRDAETIAGIAADTRAWIGRHFGKDSEIVIAEQRYGYIRGALAESVRIAPVDRRPVTEFVDRILMNRVLGLPLFFLVMWAVFRLTFVLGELPMAWLESFFGFLASRAETLVPEGFWRSLAVDGIIGGVGGVFSFVPLIVILFFCLSILEDTGYMSRAAFLTDKFLHTFGLHGQSFMPLILGFGCSVPAIMATRTLKSPQDRIATILAIPFMSCGAKLPVYVLMAGAFFPGNEGNTVMAIYLAGIVLSLLSTVALRRTVLRGATTPFVMELPPYRLPTMRGILWHVWNKTWQYTKKAGSIILFASMLIWAVTAFPEPGGEAEALGEARASIAAAHPELKAETLDAMAGAALAERRLEHSFAGRAGRFLEPAIRPLGFTWKIGVAAITGFAAKEVVVSTLGILYGAGTGETEESESLRERLRADPDLGPLVAVVLMIFILVMPPCFATLATIRSEAGLRWMAFQAAYSLALAWMLGFIVKTAGAVLGLGAGS